MKIGLRRKDRWRVSSLQPGKRIVLQTVNVNQPFEVHPCSRSHDPLKQALKHCLTRQPIVRLKYWQPTNAAKANRRAQTSCDLTSPMGKLLRRKSKKMSTISMVPVYDHLCNRGQEHDNGKFLRSITQRGKS